MVVVLETAQVQVLAAVKLVVPELVHLYLEQQKENRWQMEVLEQLGMQQKVTVAILLSGRMVVLVRR